jgi:hypothetical protein
MAAITAIATMTTAAVALSKAFKMLITLTP